MKKYIIVIVFVCLLLIAFFAGRKSVDPPPEMPDSTEIFLKEIIIRNDSIVKVNDSINFKIIEIEKEYEKTVDSIYNNNVIDDYNFFSAYIERYCGIHNLGSAKNN